MHSKLFKVLSRINVIAFIGMKWKHQQGNRHWHQSGQIVFQNADNFNVAHEYYSLVLCFQISNLNCMCVFVCNISFMLHVSELICCWLPIAVYFLTRIQYKWKHSMDFFLFSISSMLKCSCRRFQYLNLFEFELFFFQQ